MMRAVNDMTTMNNTNEGTTMQPTMHKTMMPRTMFSMLPMIGTMLRTAGTMLPMIMLLLLVSGCGSDNTTPPLTTYTIKGIVTATGGLDVSGVTLTASVSTGTPVTATTTATGEFTVSGLAAGTYTVRPSKAGFVFSPAERSITVTNADAAGVTFQMTQTVDLAMVSVEPGTFTMGGIGGYYGGGTVTRPQHQVTLTRGLLVGKYEVTQAEYEAVMGTNPSTLKNPAHPVTDIDNYQMMEFCNRLSVMNGYEPVYAIHPGDNETRSVEWNWDANGYRLPVEAEWEYFARAGTTDNTYFGNFTLATENEMDPYAWWRTYAPEQGGSNTTRPVGLKPANPWGLYDIIGNVSEACFDNMRKYDANPVTDPIGMPFGRDHVCRGGTYQNTASETTCTGRVLVPYPAAFVARGFRVVRTRR